MVLEEATRVARFNRRPEVVLSMALSVFVVLAACAGCSLFDDAAVPSQTASATRLATATPTPTGAGDTSTPTPDWYVAELPDAGFRVDMPSVLSPDHAVYINGGAGEYIAFVYTGRPASSPLKRAAAQARVFVQYTSQITDDNICPSGGTPVTLGARYSGYQQSDAPPAADGPPASYPYVRVSLVLNGEVIQLELNAAGPADTFFARYGDLWRHMLASFAPLPNQPASKNRPCG
jgi:hypothetical protein